MDEDALGLALSVTEYNKEGERDLSISLPIFSVFKVSQLSADAVKWESPIYFDRSASFSDIQIID
jgi:hypothetical protein